MGTFWAGQKVGLIGDRKSKIYESGILEMYDPNDNLNPLERKISACRAKPEDFFDGYKRSLVCRKTDDQCLLPKT